MARLVLQCIPRDGTYRTTKTPVLNLAYMDGGTAEIGTKRQFVAAHQVDGFWG